MSSMYSRESICSKTIITYIDIPVMFQTAPVPARGTAHTLTNLHLLKDSHYGECRSHIIVEVTFGGKVLGRHRAKSDFTMSAGSDGR
jgi:hypothetical protein